MGSDLSVPITQILADIAKGSRTVANDLFPLVYEELHRIAAARMANERAGNTLQTTALVNEAYLRLVPGGNVEWQSRAHFFGAAAEAMRRILVDHARSKNRLKRGGGSQKESLQEHDVAAPSDENPEMILRVDAALDRLEKVDERMARVVKLRYFAGVTIEETAQLLGVTPRTINRTWNEARAWLKSELKDSFGPGADGDLPVGP